LHHLRRLDQIVEILDTERRRLAGRARPVGAAHNLYEKRLALQEACPPPGARGRRSCEQVGHARLGALAKDLMPRGRRSAG
jgi:hypothetical protein